jgi:hypothetical protein
MDATSSFETSIDFQRTTRRYIAKDRTLYYVQWAQTFPREREGMPEIALMNFTSAFKNVFMVLLKV